MFGDKVVCTYTEPINRNRNRKGTASTIYRLNKEIVGSRPSFHFGPLSARISGFKILLWSFDWALHDSS